MSIKKTLRKELKPIADSLPLYYRLDKAGKALVIKKSLTYTQIKNNPEYLKLAVEQGLKLIPKQQYSIDQGYAIVDHLGRLIRYVKAHGEKGITLYIDLVRKEYAAYNEWVKVNLIKSEAKESPIQALAQSEIDEMNQREHEDPGFISAE